MPNAFEADVILEDGSSGFGSGCSDDLCGSVEPLQKLRVDVDVDSCAGHRVSTLLNNGLSSVIRRTASSVYSGLSSMPM